MITVDVELGCEESFVAKTGAFNA